MKKRNKFAKDLLQQNIEKELLNQKKVKVVLKEEKDKLIEPGTNYLNYF